MRVLIRVVRLLLAAFMFLVSGWYVYNYSLLILSNGAIRLEIDGILSIWGVVACFFVSIIALAMTCLESGNWRGSKYNRLYVLSCLTSILIISPIISCVISYSLYSKAEGLIECKQLNKSSRLYSSKTFSTSEHACGRQ